MWKYSFLTVLRFVPTVNPVHKKAHLNSCGIDIPNAGETKQYYKSRAISTIFKSYDILVTVLAAISDIHHGWTDETITRIDGLLYYLESLMFKSKQKPKKSCPRNEMKLLRSLKLLSKEGQFSPRRLMERTGIDEAEVSNGTVRRCLNLKTHGFQYLQARKRGLLNSINLKKREAFAKSIKRTYQETVWCESVAFFRWREFLV